MNPLDIINKYYSNNAELHSLLVRHSFDVASKAVSIAEQLIASASPFVGKEGIDMAFIHEAAMLHDIGIYLTDAEGIHCHGHLPYICHGTIGAQLLREEGLERHARVAERHTGAGITIKEIQEQGLPLPQEYDLVPETLEEKIICYADKFFSKSHPENEKTLDDARRSLQKFGGETMQRFEEMAKMFE